MDDNQRTTNSLKNNITQSPLLLTALFNTKESNLSGLSFHIFT